MDHDDVSEAPKNAAPFDSYRFGTLGENNDIYLRTEVQERLPTRIWSNVYAQLARRAIKTVQRQGHTNGIKQK
jgi:hypothetical protein